MHGLVVGVAPGYLYAVDFESCGVVECWHTFLFVASYAGRVDRVSREARSLAVGEAAHSQRTERAGAVGGKIVFVSHALTHTRAIHCEDGGAFVGLYLKASALVHLQGQVGCDIVPSSLVLLVSTRSFNYRDHRLDRLAVKNNLVGSGANQGDKQ